MPTCTASPTHVRHDGGTKAKGLSPRAPLFLGRWRQFMRSGTVSAWACRVLALATGVTSIQAAQAQSLTDSGCLRRELVVQGTQRTGWVCPPQAPNAKAPLLLAFHGRGSSGQELAQALQLHRVWPQALVVYPDGLPGNPSPHDPTGKQAGWQIHLGEQSDRDLAMVRALLPALQQRWGFDCHRVYALGHSNGARLAALAWATQGEHFAAFAFSAAPPDTLAQQAPARDVFLGMGQADTVVPLAVQAPSLSMVAQRLGVALPPDGRESGRWTLKGHSGHTLSVLIHPQGHLWPSGQTQQILALFAASSLERCAP